MVETFLSNNTIFAYGAFILISAFSIVYIPVVTPIILGVTGLAWTWSRQKSSPSYNNSNNNNDTMPLIETLTWASVYEKLEKNTSDVRYLSRLRMDTTQHQQAHLENLELDLETLTNEFSTYRSVHEKDLTLTIQSLNSLREQYDILKHDNANMTNTIDTLRLNSSNQEQHHKSALQTQLSTSQLDRDTMSKKLAAMEQIKHGLELDLERLQQCRNTDIEKVTALATAVDQLGKEHMGLRNENESLQLENNSLTEKITAMEQKGKTWHQQTATFEQQLDTLTQEKAALEQSLANLEQEKTNHASHMDTLQQEMDTLKERSANEMDEMTQELATIKDKNQHLTQQVETIQHERDELKDQLNKEKWKMEHLQLFVRESTKESHRAAADALSYQQQVEDMKTQLEQQQDQCVDMEQQINELTMDVHEKDMALTEMQEKQEQLVTELDDMGRKLEQGDDDLISIMDRIRQHTMELEHLEKDKETIVMELETLEENKKMVTMDLEAMENELCKISAALKKSSWPQQSDEGSTSWQQHSNRPRSPHFVYPIVKASRSSSIPRLSNTNLTLSRSKSSRLATSSSGAVKSVAQQELYQTVRRLEGVIAELQRQLDDSHAQLEDREQRLCHFLSNDIVR